LISTLGIVRYFLRTVIKGMDHEKIRKRQSITPTQSSKCDLLDVESAERFDQHQRSAAEISQRTKGGANCYRI
jgi:hypothetical protein